MARVAPAEPLPAAAVDVCLVAWKAAVSAMVRKHMTDIITEGEKQKVTALSKRVRESLVAGTGQEAVLAKVAELRSPPGSLNVDSGVAAQVGGLQGWPGSSQAEGWYVGQHRRATDYSLAGGFNC
jgi:hypothetical protein